MMCGGSWRGDLLGRSLVDSSLDLSWVTSVEIFGGDLSVDLQWDLQWRSSVDIPGGPSVETSVETSVEIFSGDLQWRSSVTNMVSVVETTDVTDHGYEGSHGIRLTDEDNNSDDAVEYETKLNARAGKSVHYLIVD